MTRDSHGDENRFLKTPNHSHQKPRSKRAVVTLFPVRAITLGSCVSIQ